MYLIEVTVRKDEIKISGHANYVAYGQDIICAGVTALARTLIKSTLDLTEDKIKYEFILGLRLTKGINKDNFNKKYGINISEIEVIKELISKGLLIDDKINIYVPKKYFYVLNDILVNFV